MKHHRLKLESDYGHDAVIYSKSYSCLGTAIIKKAGFACTVVQTSAVTGGVAVKHKRMLQSIYEPWMSRDI